MSIRTKIIFALSILLGLMASQLVITITQVGRIASISTHIATRGLESLTSISQLESQLIALRLEEQTAIFTPHSNALFPDDQLLPSLMTAAVSYRAASGLPQARLAAWQEQLDTFIAQHHLLQEQLVAGNIPQATTSYENSTPVFTGLLAATRALARDELALNNTLGDLVATFSQQTRQLFTLALIVATLLEIGLGWYLMRSLTRSLSLLVEGTRWVAKGDLTRQVNLDTRDEFAYLARSFNAMVSALRQVQQANAQMQEILREQFSRIVKAQEDERQRVARELHDQAGQALTAIQLGLGRLEKATDLETVRAEAGSLRSLTVQTMKDIRNLALDLRPSMLDDLGLVPTLRQYLKEYSRRTSLQIEFHAPPAPGRFPPEVETTIFRVIQEATTNTAKHAGASRVTVTLATSGNQLQIRVIDDGTGFDVAAALQNMEKKSLGLFGMQERLHLIGGNLEIKSKPGNGTEVLATLPLAEDNPAGNWSTA